MQALARRLDRISPGLEVVPIDLTLADVGGPELEKMVGQCDVAIGACDDPSAQATINDIAYQLGVPAVFPLL